MTKRRAAANPLAFWTEADLGWKAKAARDLQNWRDLNALYSARQISAVSKKAQYGRERGLGDYSAYYAAEAARMGAWNASQRKILEPSSRPRKVAVPSNVTQRAVWAENDLGWKAKAARDVADWREVNRLYSERQISAVQRKAQYGIERGLGDYSAYYANEAARMRSWNASQKGR